jgi:hypothetical protein
MSKSNWISATATQNYFNEPLLDWFKYAYEDDQGKQKGTKKGKRGTRKVDITNVNDYLCKQGNQFESGIVSLLCKKVGHKNIKKINCTDAEDDHIAEETIKYMKKGIYVIFGGLLHNVKNKTYGIPDVLIRSDIINKIIVNPVIDIDTERINAPYLGKQKWHYRVIDIKFMTLSLKSDGEHLLNSGHIPSYKSQLNIYNQALGQLQGYTPGQAYLLGRRWVCQKNGKCLYDDYCFDKLGVIDYEDSDANYINLTNKAIKWIKLCKTKKAKTWDVFTYPLEKDELYPNMSNFMDGKWHDLKVKIANDNHELTELWQVGKKHRGIGLENGITSWKDPDCCADKLGINGKRAKTLDCIIDINRDDNEQLIHPTVIKNNNFNWKTPGKLELFVDFEFKNAVFDQVIKLPIADKSILLFTIGVGYIEPKSGNWVFKHFTVKHMTEECEEEIAQDFINFVYDLCKKYKVKSVNCVHWSAAEPVTFDNVLIKYKHLKQNNKYKVIEWCDLLHIFRTEPIVIKGCLNFKLKSVAKAMYEHGFISTIWEDTNIPDGQIAMIETIKADTKASKLKIPMTKLPIVKSMIKYNEIDVKVLQEILSYLRNYQKTATNKKKRTLSSLFTTNKKRKL